MKKSTMKKTLLTSLFVAFSVCAGTACIGAGADGTAITAENANVTMVAGASARISEDGFNGLRYTMTASKADYQGLKATYGANVTFGILIAPKAYDEANELNEANVFGAEAVYDWAEWDEETQTYVYAGEKTRIINLSSATMRETEDEDVYALYGTIANLKAENIAKEFVGVGYIAYGDGETTNYKFLAENDNTRSMAYVAQKYQEMDSVAQETKELVKEAYITGKADQVDTFYTVNHMFSDGNGNYTLGQAEQVTAKINSETVTPTAQTFNGYCFDKNNANNSAGGSLVYANGKTEALNLYYTNDWNKDFVQNEDGSYSMTSAGRNWTDGPAWAYTYTTEGFETTAVYSVKMESATALSAPAWSMYATGIAVTQGERIADQDTTFYAWIDVNSRQDKVPENSIYGTVIGTTAYANYDVTLVTNRGMGFSYGLGGGSAAKMNQENSELTLTLALYKNVFYVYVNDVFVGTRNVNDNGDWNGFVALKVPSGNKYGYKNDLGFKFGVGNYNCGTDVKFTVVTEKYGEEALAEMNANSVYKYSILTPMTANVTKNTDGSYTHSKGWFSPTAYSYEYSSTNFSDTVVYKTQITTTATDIGSCNPGGQWWARVGIAFTNGQTIGANTFKDRLGTSRACQEDWLSSGYVGLSAFPVTSGDARKWITVGAGPDGPDAYLHSQTATEWNQHSRYHALGSPVCTNVTLTAVLYEGTIYVYFNDTYATSISLDSDLLDWTNVDGEVKNISSSDKLIFGTTALLQEVAPTTKQVQYLTDDAALAEITTNALYANIGA